MALVHAHLVNIIRAAALHRQNLKILEISPVTRDGKKPRTLVWMFLLGAWYAVVLFVLLLAAIGLLDSKSSAHADNLSEWERYRIARDIGREIKRHAKVNWSGVPLYLQKSASPAQGPTITYEEVVSTCGAQPEDECVHAFFNERFSSTAERFREP